MYESTYFLVRNAIWPFIITILLLLLFYTTTILLDIITTKYKLVKHYVCLFLEKESLLMHDLKSSMAVDGLGYGSAFTVKLLEIARKKDFLTTAELFNAFSAGMNK